MKLFNSICIIVTLFICPLHLFCQTSIKGKVLDSSTLLPIPFVNIEVRNNLSGSISNEDGSFELILQSLNSDITFSSIGYTSKVIKSADIHEVKEVFLLPISYKLADIKINAEKFGEPKKLGKKIKRKNTVWGLVGIEKRGVEVGMKIKINRETLIKSAHFGMHANSPDSILFRVNLYDYSDGKLGKNLMPKNLYVYSKDLEDYGQIDLSHLNITVFHDVLLTLQSVKDNKLHEGDVMFRIKSWWHSSNIMYRDATHVDFSPGVDGESSFINDRIGFYLIARQAGKSKDSDQNEHFEEVTSVSGPSNMMDSIQYLFENSIIPGVVITIMKKGEIIHKKTFGFADVAKNQSYSNLTNQPIASISKTFVGLAIMQLKEKGLLTLDTPINELLPFEVTNPNHPTVPITIRHLVTHTSSIKDTSYNYYDHYYIKDYQDTTTQVARALKTQGVVIGEGMTLASYLENCFSTKGQLYTNQSFDKKAPGTVYQYSNIGASLAAYIVEYLSKKPFHEYIKNNIFTPLKMSNSGYSRSNLDSLQLSTLYASKEYFFPEYYHPSYPDGWVNTTNHDMSLYLMDMMNGARGNGTLLSPEGYKSMFSRQSPNHIFKENHIHGVFWDIAKDELIHTGGDLGVLSYLSINPLKRSGVFMMTNMNPDGLGNKLGINEEVFYNEISLILEMAKMIENE